MKDIVEYFYNNGFYSTTDVRKIKNAGLITESEMNDILKNIDYEDIDEIINTEIYEEEL